MFRTRKSGVLLIIFLFSFPVVMFSLILPARYNNARIALRMASSSAKGMNENMSVQNNIILYDGVCNFCNKWVDLVLKIDTKKQFSFSALQSQKGKELLQIIGRERSDISSVVFIKSLGNQELPPEFYTKSDAALQVCELLGPMGKLASLTVTNLIPQTARDVVYDGVANNRYSILGKREECRCSDSKYSDRFI